MDRFAGEIVSAVQNTRTWVDDNGYRLSDRLWLARQADRDAIDTILRRAMASKAHKQTAVANLNRYLNPNTPGGNYAARRLLQTELSRAMGAAVVESAKLNPFVKRIRWRLGPGHSDQEADVCDDNATKSSGRGFGRGEYRIDDVPRFPGHPNCKCSLTPIYREGRAGVDLYAARESLRGSRPRVRKTPTTTAPTRELVGGHDVTGLSASNRSAVESMVAGGVPSDVVASTAQSMKRADMAARRAAQLVDDSDRLARSSQPWVDSLSAAERDALQRYASTDYRPVNDYLRHGSPIDDERRAMIGQLDAAIGRATISDDVRVYRALSPRNAIHSSHNPQPGLEFVDHGFGSTSLAEGTASRFAGGQRELVEIVVPKGRRGAYIEPVSSTKNEFEVLLPRDTRYRVVGRTPDDRVLVEVMS